MMVSHQSKIAGATEATKAKRLKKAMEGATPQPVSYRSGIVAQPMKAMQTVAQPYSATPFKGADIGRFSVKAFERSFEREAQGMPDSQRKMLVQKMLRGVLGIAEKEGVSIPDVASSKANAANKKFLSDMAEQANLARAACIKDGSLLPAAALQEKLSISKQAVSKALMQHRLFAVDGPAGENLYPAFFTDPQYNRRVLEKVSKALGDLPGPGKWQFFTTKKASLSGRTPLEALQAGDVERVLVAAAGFAER